MLKLLLENGAKIYNKDKFGMNAIEYAQKVRSDKNRRIFGSKIEKDSRE